MKAPNILVTIHNIRSTNRLDRSMSASYNSQVINQPQMKDEFLSRCVVDPVKRTVYLYSTEGSEKEVQCDTVDEFMNVLNFVRDTVGEDVLSYASPL